jgi:hypothetical protein
MPYGLSNLEYLSEPSSIFVDTPKSGLISTRAFRTPYPLLLTLASSMQPMGVHQRVTLIQAVSLLDDLYPRQRPLCQLGVGYDFATCALLNSVAVGQCF